MKIWPAPGITYARAAVAAGFMAIPIVAFPAHGAAAAVRATAPPSAPPSASAARSATRPRLSIGVSDGQTAARVGDLLTYTVSVRNAGPTATAHLKITQTLPPGVRFVSASRHGAAAAGTVTWHSGVPANGTDTFRVTGRVMALRARLLRLAVVACASVTGRAAPVVCAADLDQTAGGAALASKARRVGGGSPAGYAAGGGLAVLVVGALAVIIGRRTRFQRRMRHSG